MKIIRILSIAASIGLLSQAVLAISVTIYVNVHPTCNYPSGTIVAGASGGVGPYTYLWSNGQTAATAAGLVANTYTVVATDANGCANTLTATVPQPPPFALNTMVTNVACSGGANGTAAVAVSGGTPPYAYQWNTGQTSAGISGLRCGCRASSARADPSIAAR